MLCAVYKSSRKADTYLFVNKRDCFDDVPEALMEMFGAPQLVMVFPIAQREHLGLADINRVRTELADKGYYLQLPPPPENLLQSHRQELGLED
ncbi:YcgL domain-containing protein [Shewanella submarina]|uniref:YcgL domain-containing protein ACFOE0_14310 n=1 Tax=Shewanella submarina TaxID=2016376 RepID=A0ABV7GCU8_9GAMM|nr:YcgL domain-containing protein [Shewanella submarina]MCL1039105.1 YcgL domain-containing protein [Shewanella submarina]